MKQLLALFALVGLAASCSGKPKCGVNSAATVQQRVGAAKAVANPGPKRGSEDFSCRDREPKPGEESAVAQSQ